MPSDAILVTAIVTGVITIFSLALVYGQRQTTAYFREHPQK
jgi:DMSO reductase anchor subunit